MDLTHTTAGFAKSVLCNQLAFKMQIAALRTEKADTPLYDAQIMAAMGDNGLPQPTKLDLDDLITGYACAFILVARHVSTPHPETGRKEEHLLKYLKTPEQVITDGVKFRVTQAEQQTIATAAMLKADPSTRIEIIRSEAIKQ